MANGEVALAHGEILAGSTGCCPTKSPLPHGMLSVDLSSPAVTQPLEKRPSAVNLHDVCQLFTSPGAPAVPAHQTFCKAPSKQFECQLGTREEHMLLPAVLSMGSCMQRSCTMPANDPAMHWCQLAWRIPVALVHIYKSAEVSRTAAWIMM